MSLGSVVAPSGPLDRAVAPLDRLRRYVLLGLVRTPALGRLIARRDARLLVHSVASVAVTFALTLLCPGVLFVAGPALFGVAHVAADARYLVLRRALPRWWTMLLGAGCFALFALRALESAFPERWPFAATELAVGWTWALTGVAAGVAAAANRGASRRGAVGRALLVGPLVATLGLAAVTHPHLARLVFAHVHNVVAIALWLFLFRARRRFALPALALLVGCATLLLTGVALPWVHLAGPGAARFVDESLFAWPTWMPQRTALALGVLYVMLQAIHYTVWLAFIPQDDARAEGTLSFRMSLRALARDFPAPWLAVVVMLAAAVLGASLLDAHRTRQLYLSLATFHGYLELAAAAFFVVRGSVVRGK
jgi:hypothetical protein